MSCSLYAPEHQRTVIPPPSGLQLFDRYAYAHASLSVDYSPAITRGLGELFRSCHLPCALAPRCERRGTPSAPQTA